MDKRVTIRLPDNLYEKLNGEAKEKDMTISELIRHKIDTSKKSVCNKRLTKELLYELNRIGNNLNQIARHANKTKAVDIATLKQLTVIEEELLKLLEMCGA